MSQGLEEVIERQSRLLQARLDDVMTRTTEDFLHCLRDEIGKEHGRVNQAISWFELILANADNEKCVARIAGTAVEELRKGN